MEGAALVGTVDGPAGEDGGESGDVGLGVAAVDAEGVELHHFPAVVLVEAAVAFLRVGVGGVDAVGDGVGADGQPVVEVDHHGRAGGGGEEEVAELAEGVFADGVALVAGGVPLIGVFADVDVEVIEPEVGHDLLELALGEDGAKDFGLRELVDDLVGRADVGGHAVEDLALAGVEVGEEEIFLVVRRVGGEGDAVGDGEFDECGHALIFRQREEFSGDAGGGCLIGFLLFGDFGFGGWGEDGLGRWR